MVYYHRDYYYHYDYHHLRHYHYNYYLRNFDLKKTLAKVRNGSIFANISFYFLPEVWSEEALAIKKIPPPEEMTLIIASGGGKVINKLPTKKDNRIVVIAPPIDILNNMNKGSMTKLENIVKNGSGKGFYSAELILSSSLTQVVDFNKNYIKLL